MKTKRYEFTRLELLKHDINLLIVSYLFGGLAMINTLFVVFLFVRLFI